MKRWILALVMILSVQSWTSPLWALCPDEALKETQEDCPWAEFTRDLEKLGSSKEVWAYLETKATNLVQQIQADAADSEMLVLWGTSLNFDEGAKAEIIKSWILESLNQALGVKSSESPKTHAGVAHTYGYLLSNLQTPFGYKRARWVRPTLDLGFDFPSPTLSPFPQEGTLFSNVTFLAGRIAFRQEFHALEILEKNKDRVAQVLQDLEISSLKIQRVTETVDLSPLRTIKIRTDLVAFSTPVEKDPNTHWLIYSILDSDMEFPQLITAFPVTAGAVDGLLDPKKFGENVTITTRYNAFVPGLTGKSFKGRRVLE